MPIAILGGKVVLIEILKNLLMYVERMTFWRNMVYVAQTVPHHVNISHMIEYNTMAREMPTGGTVP